MDEISSQLQLGVAEVFGLNAAVLMTLLWRAKVWLALPRLLGQHRSYRAAGIASPETVANGRLLMMLFGFAGVAILAALFFIWETYHYLSHVHLLIGEVGATDTASRDLALFRRLQRHAMEVRERVVLLSILTLLITVVGWIIEALWSPVKLKEGDAWRDDHPHSLPLRWRDAPLMLWRKRFNRSLGRLREEDGLCEDHREVCAAACQTGEWQDNWATWARCVVAYHNLIARVDERDDSSQPHLKPIEAE